MKDENGYLVSRYYKSTEKNSQHSLGLLIILKKKKVQVHFTVCKHCWHHPADIKGGSGKVDKLHQHKKVIELENKWKAF